MIRIPLSVTAAGSRLLRRPNASPSTWRWSAGDSAYTSFSTGGSAAVMFEPGKIMKMGQPWRTPTQSYSTITRIEFDEHDAPVSSGGWVQEAVAISQQDQPQPRVEPNMTMLPDGNVLVSGGRSKHEDDGTAFRRPQIWYPATNTWSGRTLLDEDPSTRGYHSTALLTPDARVISAGGSHQNNANYTVGKDSLGTFAVFSPPYLYSDATTLAVRPPVGTSAYPQVVKPGQVFTVCTDSAVSVAKVALLKPGSATHAFNMDQRYVSLAFARVTGAAPRLFVTAPASVNHAPPGDYLIYLVGASGTPSVGRWMRVETTAGSDLCDTFKPGKVGALNGCHDEATNTVNLSWVSPPEDSAVTGSGPGTEFALRYSTSSINNETAWRNATPVSLGFAPATEGSTHTAQLTLSDGTYYFRLKTKDDNENWSAMSTQSTVEVPADPPTECFEGGGGGGGGGGSSARRGAEETRLVPGSGAGESLPNATTLFPRPARQGLTSDVLRLSFDPSEGGAEASVWVSANPGVGMQLDRVALQAVDHAPEQVALVSGEGLVTGVLGEVESLARADSTVLPPSESFTLETGEVAHVGLGDHGTLVMEAVKLGESTRGQRNGVLVQVPQGSGWRTVQRVVPRRVAEPVAVAVGVSTVRLLALEDTRLEGVGVLSQSTTAHPTPLPLLTATSSTGDDATSAIGASDSARASLAGGQSVAAAFDVPQLAAGLTRTWFLAASASFERSVLGATRRQAAQGEAVPLRFALHQNRPNPFARRTAIAFDLPRGEAVTLEVFDAGGRRVRTLSSGWRPAGSHRVEWDQRDRHGSLVRAGVYLYRLRSAGSGVVERKLVVLP